MPEPTLVLVPAWNEERSVGAVVGDVRAAGFDVLVVDDGSGDATAATARAAGAVVVRLPVHLGVGAALRCGFAYAVEHGYGRVVQCDADGQHPAGSIQPLLQAQDKARAHLMIGSRFLGADPGMPVARLRRSAMHLLARRASRAAQTRVTDPTSGFRVFASPLLEQFARSFPAHYLGDTFEALVTAGRAGYKVREVPVTMRARQHGTSSASRLDALRFTVRALIVATSGLHFPIEPLPDQRRAVATSA